MDDELAGLTVLELDQLGVLAAEGDPSVEIVDAAVDRNAEHGSNSEPQMGGGIIRRGFARLVSKAKARLSTSQLRRAWSPPCTGPWARLSLFGEGIISIRPACIEAFKALSAVLAAWKYSTRRADTGAYNCRKITGGTGYSLHAYAIAADLNWLTNPYGRKLKTDMPRGMVDAILRIRTNSGAQVFGWGGDYSGNKDGMHFEVICSPADLATGIDWSTVPGTAAPLPKPQPPKPKPVEEDMARIVKVKESGSLWVMDGVSRRTVTTKDAGLLAIAGLAQLDKGGVPFVLPRSAVELVPENK